MGVPHNSGEENSILWGFSSAVQVLDDLVFSEHARRQQFVGHILDVVVAASQGVFGILGVVVAEEDRDAFAHPAQTTGGYLYGGNVYIYADFQGSQRASPRSP